MHRQAGIQDSLLQSYRAYFFAIQSILLAAGAVVATLGLLDHSLDEQLVLLLILIAVFGLSLYSGIKFRNVILSRQKDVDYWQKAILEGEKLLLYDQRVFTAFKIHQKLKRQTLDQSALYQKMDDPAFFASLIQKDKGHTRAVVDSFVPMAFLFAWQVILGVAAACFFF